MGKFKVGDLIVVSGTKMKGIVAHISFDGSIGCWIDNLTTRGHNLGDVNCDRDDGWWYSEHRLQLDETQIVINLITKYEQK